MIDNKDEIIENADIVSVINELTGNKLRRAGSSYQMCCPFHDEKTPSFSVSPSRQTYKCFGGCGVGGDVANFVMELKHKSFPEALQYLANHSQTKIKYQPGTDFETSNKKAKEKSLEKESQLIHHNQVSEFYFKRTWGADKLYPQVSIEEEGLKLDNRSWSYQTVKEFQLSFAHKNIIAASFENQKWNREVLINVGILKEGNSAEYDFFSNRILFPIFSRSGDVVGFGGRKLVNEKSKYAKYFNSSDGGKNLIYKKSKTLYGLFQAQKSLSKTSQAILVEGYTDVISLHDNGIKNVVAASGTAFSDEQAKLLTRYVKNVLLLFDGDNAGEKSVNLIYLLLQQGIQVNICRLPKDQDPDSFIREKGADTFNAYLHDNTHDAIEYSVLSFYKNKEGKIDKAYKNDPFKRELALRQATLLLSYIDSESIREGYIKKLITARFLGVNKATIRDAIQDQLDVKLTKNKTYLTPKQLSDQNQFGIYIGRDNCYYRGMPGDKGTAITNFHIDPIMLVKSANFSKRIIQIKNEMGSKVLLDIISTDLTQKAKFEGIIEGEGDFLFEPHFDPKDYQRIKKLLYSKTPNCTMIEVLGLHPKGFWVWGNGISHEDKFLPVNEFGIVYVDDEAFFLPAFSKVTLQFAESNRRISYGFHRPFIYKESPEVKVEPIKWARDLVKVHGENAMVTIAYYLATLNRMFIWEKFSFFPLLNFWGPPDKGKSSLARQIMYCFGKQDNSTNLGSSTKASLERRAMQKVNAIQHNEEYLNSNHPDTFIFIKDAWDGGNRQKADKDSDINTFSSVVTMSQMIVGQENMTYDAAMISRPITILVDGKQIKTENEKLFHEIDHIGKQGYFSQITHHFLKYRKFVEEDFISRHDIIKKKIIKQLKKYNPSPRLLDNHIIPLTSAYIIGQHTVLGFKYDDLEAAMIELLKSKCLEKSNESDTGIFWELIHESMTKVISNSRGYLVKDELEVKIHLDAQEAEKEGSNTKVVNLGKLQKVLFLTLTDAYGYYLDKLPGRFSKKGLPKKQMLKYLRMSSEWIGPTYKKMKGQTKKCYAFRAKHLPFGEELEYTYEYLERTRKTNIIENSGTPEL